MEQSIYIAVDKSDKHLPVKIGIAVCPRCRMVEYNNTLRFRERRHGQYEIAYKTKPVPSCLAKNIERKVHEFLAAFNAKRGGRETFYVSKTLAIKVVRLAMRGGI